MAYGACNVIAFSEGPFYIFSRIREWAYNINEHFAKVFTCMMCLPANFGWLCSLINYLFIPIPFTPFNIIFYQQSNLWLLMLLCDGALTSGAVYLIYILNEYFEKRIDYYEQNTIRNTENIIGYEPMDDNNENLYVEDITLNNNGK
jgi:hypothetical protein